MNSKLIESIANAVLYEGYMLYPYRPSAVKNRQRWNFGVIHPRISSGVQNGDARSMQTECLIRASESSVFNVRVRFLQSISRRMGKPEAPVAQLRENSEPDFEIVESVEVEDKVYRSWEEALEREIVLPPIELADLLGCAVHQVFTFAGSRDLDPVKAGTGSIAAFIVRVREDISGSIEMFQRRDAQTESSN